MNALPICIMCDGVSKTPSISSFFNCPSEMNIFRSYLNCGTIVNLKTRKHSNTLKCSQRMGGGQIFLKTFRASLLKEDLSNEPKKTRRRVWRGRGWRWRDRRERHWGGRMEETFLCLSLTWKTCRFTVPPTVALLNYISCGILWRIFCQTGIFRGFPLVTLKHSAMYVKIGEFKKNCISKSNKDIWTRLTANLLLSLYC